MPIRHGLIFLIVLAAWQCTHHKEIVLEQVVDLPENFSENIHFGKDLQSIQKLKQFVLITGRIDTTSESPPPRKAVIMIDHKRLFLPLRKSVVTGDEINERYRGAGYDLSLVYK